MVILLIWCKSKLLDIIYAKKPLHLDIALILKNSFFAITFKNLPILHPNFYEIWKINLALCEIWKKKKKWFWNISSHLHRNPSTYKTTILISHVKLMANINHFWQMITRTSEQWLFRSMVLNWEHIFFLLHLRKPNALLVKSRQFYHWHP